VTMVGVQHCHHKFRSRAEGKMGRNAPFDGLQGYIAGHSDGFSRHLGY
jgi:hypothetical protein